MKLYVAGQAFSAFGDGIAPIALVAAALTVDPSHGTLGTILAVGATGTLIFVLLGGALADAFTPMLVMMLSDFLRCAAQAVSAFLIGHHRSSTLTLCIACGVVGAGSSMFKPAASKLLPLLVSPAETQSANSVISISREACRVFGPVAAGLLLLHSGPSELFLLDALTYAASIASLAMLIAQTGGETAKTAINKMPPHLDQTRHPSFQDALSYVLRTEWLRTVIAWASLLHLFVIAPFLALAPEVVESSQRRLGFGQAGPGWASIMVGYSIGVILAGLISLRLRIANRIAFGVGATIGLAPFLVTVGFHEPLWLQCLLASLAGAGLIVFVTMFDTELQNSVPSNILGRVSSIDLFLSLFLLPIGLFASSAVAERIGHETVLRFAASWLVVSTLLILLIPSVRYKSRRGEVR